MTKISNDFILGGIIGFFFYNYFYVFILGFSIGIFVQENYGSLPNLLKCSMKSLKSNSQSICNYYLTKDGSGEPVEQKTKTNEDETFENKLDEMTKVE